MTMNKLEVRSLKRSLLYLFLAANLFFVLWTWFSHAWFYSGGNRFAAGTPSLLLLAGNLAGLLAVLLVLLQLLLVGRIRWVEQLFGLDRLTRVHAWNGRCVLTCLVLHPLLITFGHALRQSQSPLHQFMTLVRDWPDVKEALLGALLFLCVLAISSRWVRKRIKYEVWYSLHLLAYPALFLAMEHQFEVGGDLTEDSLFAFYWHALYFFVFANFLFFRFVLPVYFFVRHRFRIDRVERETEGVVSLYITGRDLDRFKIRAGQFMILRFLSGGFWMEAHPFSLSIAPNGEFLRVSIKRLGDFTAKVPNLKPGTFVTIDGPCGIFTSANATHDKFLLIAGGIGITPLRAMAEELSKAGKDTILLYGNRSESDIVFRKELDDLTSVGPLKVHHVLDDKNWPGEKGYIDRQRVARLVPDVIERDIYVCGPPVMLGKVLTVLKELKIPESQIHYELFSL